MGKIFFPTESGKVGKIFFPTHSGKVGKIFFPLRVGKWESGKRSNRLKKVVRCFKLIAEN